MIWGGIVPIFGGNVTLTPTNRARPESGCANLPSACPSGLPKVRPSVYPPLFPPG